jgi:hypothetical protein
MNERPRILLGHLNSLGDCLYVTVIARQIKEIDFPGCHLTWAVNNNCAQAVMLNPYIDEIWKIPTKLSYASRSEWNSFVNIAEERKKNGDFDITFYTQIMGDNELNYDGGIRSSTYNNYPFEIVIPQQPVIRLSDNEVENVKQFVVQFELSKYKNVLLIECGPESFQSHLNASSALQLAADMTSTHQQTAVILSSSQKIESTHPHVFDASVLSFRENAELTKYCTLFLGCSSGISWLATTDWAKPLPKVIVTDYHSRLCSSMIYDHEYASLPTDKIIEFQESRSVIKEIHQCLDLILSQGFETAKTKYRKPAKLKNFSFVYRASREGFKKGEFNKAIAVFKRSNKRNGFNASALFYLLKAYLKMPMYYFPKKRKK